MIENSDHTTAKLIANRIIKIQCRVTQNLEISRLPFDMRNLVENYLQVLFHREERKVKHE